MAVVHSLNPIDIQTASGDFETRQLYIMDGSTETTVDTYYLNTQNFLNKIIDYFPNQEIAIVDVVNQTLGSNTSGNLYLSATGGGNKVVSQSFNIPVLQNKQYNDYCIFFLSTTLNGVLLPRYLQSQIIHKNSKKCYPAQLSNNDLGNQVLYNIYSISNDVILFKAKTAPYGNRFLLFNKNEIIEYQENKFLKIHNGNSITPFDGTTSIQCPGVNSSNIYYYLVPLKGIDYNFEREPKELYYEAIGNSVNSSFTKNGIRYISFGGTNIANNQVLVISSKAIDLE